MEASKRRSETMFLELPCILPNTMDKKKIVLVRSYVCMVPQEGSRESDFDER
jgi:hypothetical protein